jgi:hypothetical protein
VRGWGASIPSSLLTRTAVICSFAPGTSGRQPGTWPGMSSCRAFRTQCESVQRDDFFPGQLVGGAPAHDRQRIALLDELAHRVAESGHARKWTTADAW